VNTKVWIAGGVSISNPLAYSSDGKTWYNSNNGTASYPFSDGICNALAWNGGKWVAGGKGTNPLAYSYDGMVWYQSSNGGSIFTTQCNGLTWNASYWIATGQGTNTLAYSQDGITWTAISNSLYSNAVGKAICSRRVIPNTGGGGGSGSSNINTVSLPTLDLTIGYNQTWQDMTAVRALDVTYYNNTGRPIMVNISMILGGYNDEATIYLIINNIYVSYLSAGGTSFNSSLPMIAIIPNGASYRTAYIEDSGSPATYILNKWIELR
jgi:hypothetical protein